MNSDKIIKLIENVSDLAREIHFAKNVTSTFDMLELYPPSDGLTVVAEHQTNGRGRLGRTWESSDGGIYFSFLVSSKQNAGLITLSCAYGVCRAIRKYIDCDIKWPNDIVSNGKKICGILCKSSISEGKRDFVSVGIGINANTEYFGENLPYASSIKLISGKEVDREQLFADIICSLNEAVYKENTEEMLKNYKKLCVNINNPCTVHYVDGRDDFTGVCKDILTDGSMAVENGEKTVFVNSGEVSVKGIYGCTMKGQTK